MVHGICNVWICVVCVYDANAVLYGVCVWSVFCVGSMICVYVCDVCSGIYVCSVKDVSMWVVYVYVLCGLCEWCL